MGARPIPQEKIPVPHIETMVDTFYAKVREDEVLGPIFERRIEDWPLHLERMVLFWRAVLRSEPTFKISERGAPPILHQRIVELEAMHFDRWLGLFRDVVDQTYPEPHAQRVREAARRIANALSRHLPRESS